MVRGNNVDVEFFVRDDIGILIIVLEPDNCAGREYPEY